jgi:hypothetical protein
VELATFTRKDLAEVVTEILRAILRIVCTAAVAGRDVKVRSLARPKADPSRFVIAATGGLRHRQNGLRAGCIHQVHVRRRNGVSRDDGVESDAVDVVDVKLPVAGEVGIEREAQQSALAGLVDQVQPRRPEVEEWRRGDGPAGKDLDRAAFLDNEHPAVVGE